MSVIGFHHAGIVVPDLDRAREFYCALFGFEQVREAAWDAASEFNQIVGLTGSAARFSMLQGCGCYLELFEFQAPRTQSAPLPQASTPGIRHLCFQVTDVDEVLERLVELGGSRMNEPVTRAGGATATYCRDPFGNLLEIVESLGRFPSLTDRQSA